MNPEWTRYGEQALEVAGTLIKSAPTIAGMLSFFSNVHTRQTTGTQENRSPSDADLDFLREQAEKANQRLQAA